jgi:4-hydroxyphenylpyruvate dioxygenase
MSIAGNMDKWWDFYGNLFNFKQIRFFDIEGKHHRLFQRALTSPCGKIRIPINESPDEHQPDRGIPERIQGRRHPAHRRRHRRHLCRDRQLAANGLRFMPAADAYYYELQEARDGHEEPVDG